MPKWKIAVAVVAVVLVGLLAYPTYWLLTRQARHDRRSSACETAITAAVAAASGDQSALTAVYGRPVSASEAAALNEVFPAKMGVDRSAYAAPFWNGAAGRRPPWEKCVVQVQSNRDRTFAANVTMEWSKDAGAWRVLSMERTTAK